MLARKKKRIGALLLDESLLEKDKATTYKSLGNGGLLGERKRIFVRERERESVLHQNHEKQLLSALAAPRP